MKIKSKMGSFYDFYVNVLASIWTILQNIAHVWWIKHGRFLISCEFKITEESDFFVYLSYLYSDSCEDEHEEILTELKKISNNTDIHEEEITYYTTLVKLYEEFPLIELILDIYVYVDVIWLISGVALLISTVVRLKECSAAVCNTPWIFISVISLILDLFLSLYFGMEVIKSQEQTSETSPETQISYSIIMAVISARLGFIWILNLIFVILVAKATWIAYHRRYSDEKRTRSTRNSNLNNNNSHQNTIERIRSWQQFYGPIEDGEKSDFDYSIRFNEFPEQDLCSTIISKSPKDNRSVNNELRGQLPWSYTENGSIPKPKDDSRRVIVLAPHEEEEVSYF